MTAGRTRRAVAYCETHGKLSYTNRKRAKSVARLHPEHKSTYRCSDNEQLWHIGSLPLAVKQGHISKDEYYGRNVPLGHTEGDLPETASAIPGAPPSAA